MLFHALLSIDTGLSRVDPSTLSEQTRMELFVDGLDDQSKKQFQDSDGGYIDIEDWPGVTLDAEQNVTNITWKHEEHFVKGRLSFDMLPSHLKEFNITFKPFAKNFSVRVTGTVDAAALPRGLHRFIIDSQKLGGSLDLPALPEALHFFRMNYVRLSGSLVFAGMPQRIAHLDLSCNEFTGTLNTADLPRSLERFLISYNQLHGSLDLSALPPRLVLFTVAKNNFSGTLNLQRLPVTLAEVYLTDNAFHGELNFSNLPEPMITLRLPAGRFEGVNMETKPKCVYFAD